MPLSFESYEQSLTAPTAVSRDHEAGGAKHSPRKVFAVTGKQEDDAEDNTALRKCVKQLEEALEWATKGVLAMATGSGRAAQQGVATASAA